MNSSALWRKLRRASGIEICKGVGKGGIVKGGQSCVGRVEGFTVVAEP